jgi:hypothetical protein
MDDEQWDFYSIMQYISDNIVGFALLILAFVIIYVVDHVNRLNALVFASPSPIPMANNILPKPKSKRSKK